jgi:hypothetical protein
MFWRTTYYYILLYFFIQIYGQLLSSEPFTHIEKSSFEIVQN